MTSKRQREDGAEEKLKKRQKRSGFQVGPENLPDGTYRRKAQKIKQSLIQKAKIKKDFAKIKARAEADEEPSGKRPVYDRVSEDDEEEQGKKDEEPGSLELHPDRQAMLDNPNPNPNPNSAPPATSNREWQSTGSGSFMKRKARRDPFAKETDIAKQRQEDQERRQKEWEERDAERTRKIEERERIRRATAKARKPGRDGKLKLGRESVVLLEKVKRMMRE